MNTPKVSVLMPVYNTEEKYLREAVDSILKQTFKDFEFIIVDDGSTNNVSDVIKSYQDKRIKYFYKENSGVADTLNYGIKKSLGEYIARMDSDDISLPQRFERQVAYLDNHKNISLVSALYERFPDYFIPDHPEQVKVLDLLKGCLIAHPAVMFRKKDFTDRHLYYDSSYQTEDYDLWGRALLFGLKLINLQEVLLKYRWHKDNVTNKNSEVMAQNTQKVKDNIIQALTTDVKLQEKLKHIYDAPVVLNSTRKVYILGLKLFEIQHNDNKKIYYLFGCIPFVKVKEKRNG